MRVWLLDDTLGQLEELAGATRLPKTQLCTSLLAAALECVSRTGRVAFPIRFQVVEQERP